MQVKAYPTSPRVEITASDTHITPHAGLALIGPMLDRLGLEALVDERLDVFERARGYSEGELVRTIVETQLLGGDFCSDAQILAAPATALLRGDRDVPHASTLTRFLSRATAGTPRQLDAIMAEMFVRAWRAGGAPDGERLLLDVDSTICEVSGKTKQGASFSYTGEVALHPLAAICGNTGEVISVRLRKGSAYPSRGGAHLVSRALATLRRADTRPVHVRGDSAFYAGSVVAGCVRAGATFSITARQNSRIRAEIVDVHDNMRTVWSPAAGMTDGSEIAEIPFQFGQHLVRLIVRRSPKSSHDQLSLDDLDGYRFHALITNAAGPASEIELLHRGRGGACEEAIRELKADFGLAHLPVAAFFGNWIWTQCAAIALNTAIWLRSIALPRSFRRARAKRLRLHVINVAARLVHTGRRLILRLPAGHPHVAEIRAAQHAILLMPQFS